MTDPIYAIGDVHGQSDALKQALAWVEADGGPDAHIVFLGDYTDRGADSSGVIATLISGIAAGRKWFPIKGNHDRMFEWFMQDHPKIDPHLFTDLGWLHERLGGMATLASYGVDTQGRRRMDDLHAEAQALVPRAHVGFLRGLPTEVIHGPLCFVHAGLRPGVAMAEQTEQDKLWIREPFLEFSDPHPWMIVHGHTALDRPAHYGNRVNMDGGAGYGRPIHPAVFEGTDCWLLGPDGRYAFEKGR